MRRAAARLSLRGRALQALAQREQSRVELRRKLLRHAAAAAGGEDGAEVDTDAETPMRSVDTLLDALEAEGLLSAERFVESRVHARQRRFGNRRIEAELARHGIAVDRERAAELAASELARAADVRQRRFGPPPADVAARVTQSRFLGQRGFSAETVARLLRSLRALA